MVADNNQITMCKAVNNSNLLILNKHLYKVKKFLRSSGKLKEKVCTHLWEVQIKIKAYKR